MSEVDSTVDILNTPTDFLVSNIARFWLCLVIILV